MQKTTSPQASFTLLELLIVIGILSTLTVAVLVVIKPAEIQKRAQDNQRFRDIKTIQTIVVQYMQSGNNPPLCNGSACTSWGWGSTVSQPCNNNWLGVNVCAFAKTVPADPDNDKTQLMIGNGVTYTTGVYYYMVANGTDYKIGTLIESVNSSKQALNDGGLYAWWFEVGTNMDLW